MAITIPEARALVIEFCRWYPVAARLTYCLRDTMEELYGDKGRGLDNIRGGYITGPGLHPGRCDLPCGNLKNAGDLTTTLRHEVIGHFGLNTFTGDQKRPLLEGIGAARQEPSMHDLWVRVEADYAGEPESLKAEEVFALYCGDIEPGHHINRKGVYERGMWSFREICIEHTRLMRLDDLENIALMVAQGLHDRTRTQRNFPALNQQFRIQRQGTNIMNENTVSPEIMFDDQADATETLYGKRPDTEVPGHEAKFDPGEAERIGDTLNGQDAAEGSADLVEEPTFLELEEGQYLDIPLLITKTNARHFPGRRPGESLKDTLTRLARERRGE